MLRRTNDLTSPVRREPITDMNHLGLRLSVTPSFGRLILWRKDGIVFSAIRQCGCRRLLCKLGRMGVVHDCVPHYMVTLEGDGSKDQL